MNPTPKHLRDIAAWLDKHAEPCDDTRSAIRVLKQEARGMEAAPDA